LFLNKLLKILINFKNF